MRPKHVAALLLETSSITTIALKEALPSIAAFLDDLIPRFAKNGRLIMIGAGTSGRLAVNEAAEMHPTFRLEPNRVIGLLAGGPKCLTRSSAELEDITDGAYDQLQSLGLDENDTLLGITAGGTTPYVRGAIAFAKKRGCLTGLLTCAEASGADHVIYIPTGPEPITGSTRMNAGTVTKIALNTITSSLMVAEGRVYENLMINLNASNEKLRDRAARIITSLLSCSREQAFERLDKAKGSVKEVISKISKKKSLPSEVPHPLKQFLKNGCKQYICIDGGGTKTSLQILDAKGKPLGKNRLGNALNINDINEEGVRKTLSSILSGINPKGSTLIAGVAGAQGKQQKKILNKLFHEFGFDKKWIRGDGELLLEMLQQPKGMVLIAGTGSYCTGINHGQSARCGGLGRVLGDEGSGYYIGLEAIKAALAAHYGWGPKTTFTKNILETYNLSDITQLIKPINLGSFSRAQIAQLAPIIITSHDPVAKKIVNDAVFHLAYLVRQNLRQLDLATSDVLLVGGLFRSPVIVEKLETLVPITPINLSDKNPVAWGISNLLQNI